jgi:hypothetical protein
MVNTFYALALIISLSFFHLTLGGIMYAPAVMKAYEALNGESQDIMFLLGMIGMISGKAFIIVAEKKFLPHSFFSSWKENLLQIYIYLMCTTICGAWLWNGFSTGFFSKLESSLVFVAIIAIATMFLLGQLIYWSLLFLYNFARRS